MFCDLYSKINNAVFCKTLRFPTAHPGLISFLVDSTKTKSNSWNFFSPTEMFLNQILPASPWLYVLSLVEKEKAENYF